MPPVTPQIAIPESTIPDVIPVPGGGFTGSLPIPSNETLGPLMTAIAGMMATLQAMASRAAGAPPVGVGGIGALRRMRPMGGGGMMTVPDRFFHLMSNTDSQNDIPSGMRKLTLEAKEIIFEADKFDFIQKTIMRATTNDMLTNASFSSGDTGTDTLIGSSGGDYISGSVPGGGGSSMNGSVVSPGTSVSEDNTATPGAIGQSTGLTGSPATPGMAENAGENRGLIINALTEAGITDPRAQANILGIVQSESGMVPQSENMNYRDPERMLQLFPSRIKSVEEARQLIAGGPEAIANALYGGEWGARNLGNTENGDGWKYRGRGYIQLTGRSNYAAASKALGIDLIGNPDLANDPAIAAKLIPWYYLQNRRINVADLSNMDIVMDATGNTTADMRETRRRNAAEQYSMLQGGSAPTGMSPGADVATNLSDYLTNLSKNITMEIEGMPARTTSPATVATTSITNVSSPAYQRVDEPLAAVDKMFDKLLDDMFV
jgi:putative chitinase